MNAKEANKKSDQQENSKEFFEKSKKEYFKNVMQVINNRIETKTKYDTAKGIIFNIENFENDYLFWNHGCYKSRFKQKYIISNKKCQLLHSEFRKIRKDIRSNLENNGYRVYETYKDIATYTHNGYNIRWEYI